MSAHWAGLQGEDEPLTDHHAWMHDDADSGKGAMSIAGWAHSSAKSAGASAHSSGWAGLGTADDDDLDDELEPMQIQAWRNWIN